MAYGRAAKAIGGAVLRASPLGAVAGPIGAAKKLLGKVPVLGGLLGGGISHKQQRRRTAKERLTRWEAIVRSGGSLNPVQLKRLAKLQRHTGKYWEGVLSRAAAISRSPSIGAGPMRGGASLAMAPVRRRAKRKAAKAKRTARRAARRTARGTRRRTSRMPPGLRRYWTMKQRRR